MKPMVPTGAVPRCEPESDTPTIDEVRLTHMYDKMPATLEKLKQLNHYSKMLEELAYEGKGKPDTLHGVAAAHATWQGAMSKAISNCADAARMLAASELPAQVYFSPASALDSMAAWHELEAFLEAHEPYYKLGIRKSSSGFTVTGERK